MKAGLAQEVKERPIIFGAESVRAILEGRKTQTRRVMKPQVEVMRLPSGDLYTWQGKLFEVVPDGYQFKVGTDVIDCEDNLPDCRDCYNFILDECPHGKRGERLWVREKLHVAPLAWARKDRGGVCYAADGDCPVTPHWRSPMLMPRWASRVDLELTGVRVERLQEITGNDAREEGVYDPDDKTPRSGLYRVSQYREAWDRLNLKRGFGWDSNPFVWVLSFKRVAD